MADWKLLPQELVEQISGHLKTSIDLLRFRSVCSFWRSAVPPNPGAPSCIPVSIPSDGINRPTLGYFTKRTVYLISPLDSTAPRSWLVKIKSADASSAGRKHLLCPLSRYRFNPSFPRPLDLLNFRIIELGYEYVLHANRCFTYPRPSSPDYSAIRKVAVTWLDGGPHFLLLGIIDKDLVFYDSVDREWTVIPEKSFFYTDVIAYNEKLYAVDQIGKTVRVGLNAELELIANPIFAGDSKCLVESRGQLLLVDLFIRTETGNEGFWKNTTRYADWFEGFWENHSAYVSARVFKLDGESQSWIVVKCLDDQVLFLGKDLNLSASAADLSWCCGNCIFFSDSYELDENSKEETRVFLGRNIGVFELGSGSMGLLSSYPEHAKIFWPPPYWASSASREDGPKNELQDSSHIYNDPAMEMHCNWIVF